jgi:hypothetical protein
MANVIKVRRGPEANLPAAGTREGELRFTTDTKDLYIDDGVNNIPLGGMTVLENIPKLKVFQGEDGDDGTYEIGNNDSGGYITRRREYKDNDEDNVIEDSGIRLVGSIPQKYNKKIVRDKDTELVIAEKSYNITVEIRSDGAYISKDVNSSTWKKIVDVSDLDWINSLFEEYIDNAVAAIGSRIDRMEGMGGALSAHDFGTLTPTQEQLIEYYCVGIWGNYDYQAGTFTWDDDNPSQSTYEINDVTHTASEIFNNTWFRNTYQNKNHRFVITNTPNTTPPVFIVTDVGVDTVGQATDALAGIAKLYNVLGTNTDGAATQAAVKDAVDSLAEDIGDLDDNKVNKSGDTMTGELSMGNHGINSVGTLGNVSAIVAKDNNLLIKGQLDMDADHGQPIYNIKNVKDPVSSTDAANKGYVNTQDTATLTSAKEYFDAKIYIAADESAALAYSAANPTVMVFYPEE